MIGLRVRATLEDADMTTRQILLMAALLASAAAAVWLWKASTSEPMGAFRTFPYTYISEAKAGYDETAVVIHRGTIDGPASVEDENGTAWPAYTDPTGKIIPLKGDKPFLVPVIPAGDSARTPVIKALGRPLKQEEIYNLVKYQTPEGAERMAAFRKEMGQ
jgi:hypothetical protein